MKKLFVLFSLTLFASCGGQKADLILSTASEEGAREFLEEEIKNSGIVGLSAALVVDQEVIWAFGVGYSDKKSKTPADENTIFRVASVSKLFTATAVMQLVEDGLVDLDEPITTYIPEMTNLSPALNSEIGFEASTVRNLLCHNSGLFSDFGNGAIYSTNFEGLSTNFTGLPHAISGRYLAHSPGTVFDYSNVGFSILGILISRVGGMDYVDYMREKVLIPLGMTNSDFEVTEEIEANRTTGYGLTGGVENFPYLRDIPAGGLNTSAMELTKFVKSIFADGGEVLSSDSLAEMMTPQNADYEQAIGLQIGLAFWLSPHETVPAPFQAYHYGDITPFHTAVLLMPEEKIGLILLCNSEAGLFALRDITAKLGREVYLEYAENPVSPAPAPVETEMSEEELLNLEGSYSGGFGLIDVSAKKNCLIGSLNGLSIQLVPLSNGRFKPYLRIMGMSFDPFFFRGYEIGFEMQNGVQSAYALCDGVPMASMERFTADKENAELWEEYCGKYEMVDLDGIALLDKAELSYDQKRGLLLFTAKIFGLPLSLPLQVVDGSRAVVIGDTRRTGDSVLLSIEEDGVYLDYAGYRMKKK